ncbi:MAG: hypothetical protein IPH16_04850 [Haliscomenobacter sp.]|nr:hypothetical protein [Haliscomenobacter sp.]
MRDRNLFQYLFIFALLSLLISCQVREKESKPDVDHIEVEVRIRRFDQALFALDTANIAPGLTGLEEEYGEFADLFFTRIVPAKNPKIAPEGPEAYLRGFLTHPEVRQLYATCQAQYGDFVAIENEFSQAFRYLKYYFPSLPTPDITTYISEYTVGSFIYGEQSLAIGLDFFLGAAYPYQKYNPENPNFSAYLTRTFTRGHMVLKTLIPLVEDLNGNAPGNRLLDYILHTGKQLYMLDKLMPDLADSTLLEMSAEQTDWLADNERDIWAFFFPRITCIPATGKKSENMWSTAPTPLACLPKRPDAPEAGWAGKLSIVIWPSIPKPAFRNCFA